ncbi:hypothetical protein [uncultured Prevotella sp.]|uniref:hypothetical protein n=1 Tax=uncultured Prevotella sp. TaxID=159272 RepID=UPI0025DAE806|nr:hypothetical protein [uncultured Prevotella sp.]
MKDVFTIHQADNGIMLKSDEGYEQVWHVNKGDDFNATFKTCTFADGTPFGIKEK